MRKFIELLTNRLTIIGLMLILQIALFIFIILKYTSNWYYLHFAMTVLGMLLTLWVLASEENPMYKIVWIIFLLTMPLFGVFFFLYARTEKLSRGSTAARMAIAQDVQRKELSKIPYKIDGKYQRHQTYLTKLDYPVYQQTESIFLQSGEAKQKHLIEELKKAEHFIFMEYFIITLSKMWDEILTVLLEKQKEGVEIRIIYDDLGSATKLPYYYHKKLTDYGFKVVRFNPMRINFNFSMNYRDHRKIVVIDNKVAFTGGINIGDEYTNEKKVFGFWHDAGILVKGPAVWSFTTMFLAIWSFSTRKDEDVSKYCLKAPTYQNNASYIPFGDIPTDKHLVAKNLYLSLINDAKESIYITAPYLILDNELITALKLAAQSGVSVNIIVPSIPDKKLVYMVSESYVEELVRDGVNVYKFKPGFIHSKMTVVDREVAMIGTSNLDFRSLYLHLENNLWLNDEHTIRQMNAYIDATLEFCAKVEANARKKNIFYRIFRAILKSFSPML